jgi:DNA-binding XRE family transcriptional regulator/SOS-response transcriptional repressor LexA
MSTEAKNKPFHYNLRQLRKRAGLTQGGLADKLNLKRAVIGAYEEGRAEPKIENLIKIASFFNRTVDEVVGGIIDLNNPTQKKDRLRILAITVNEQSKENIEVVAARAQAGYLSGYSDPEYITSLPKMSVPYLKGGTYRAFEIEGDSMHPTLETGDMVICKFIENYTWIQDHAMYVVVSDEGIVVKRIKTHKSQNTLELISDNKYYPPYKVHLNTVREIWQVQSRMTTHIGSSDDLHKRLNKLEELVWSLQEKLKKK